MENDKKKIAKYIVDRFGEAEGFDFFYRQSYILSKQAKGLPSIFADAQVYQFECSQNRRRTTKTSTVPYGKTRNRKGRVTLVDCNGSITVTFLSDSSSAMFDIAIDFNHDLHPGREQFGLPIKIRQWIKNNPRTTIMAQREDLERALENGEIEGLINEWYNPASIHYWWRKEVGQKTYPSNDPWINAEHILKQHPMVCDKAIFY